MKEMTKTLCESPCVLSNGDGSYTSSICGLPATFCDLDAQRRGRHGRCPFHMQDYVTESWSDCEAKEYGNSLLSEVILELRAGRVSTHTRMMDALVTKGELERIVLDRLDIEGLTSTATLKFETFCLLKGPIVVKNSVIPRLSVRFVGEKGVVVLVNSSVGGLESFAEEKEQVNFGINESDIGLLCTPKLVGNFRCTASRIDTVKAEATRFVERIVVIRSQVNFTSGDFSNSVIGVADTVTFSESKLNGTRYLSRNLDEWRKLKLKYSGNSALLLILLFSVFLIPVVLEVSFWLFVSRLQDFALGVINNLTLADSDKVKDLVKCLSVKCSEVSIVQIAIGWHQGASFVVLTLSLLVFNLIRFYMVREVGILSEYQELTGRYPRRGTVFPMQVFRRKSPESIGFSDWLMTYRRLVVLDKMMGMLVVVALFSTIIAAYEALGVWVFVPA